MDQKKKEAKSKIPLNIVEEASRYEDQERIRIVKRRKADQCEKCTAISYETITLSKKKPMTSDGTEITDSDNMLAGKSAQSKDIITPSLRLSEGSRKSIVREEKLPYVDEIIFPIYKGTLKLSLVFDDEDEVGQLLAKAAEKLNFEVVVCTSHDMCLEEFQLRSHDVVMVDARNTGNLIDYDTLCRSIRNTKGSQHSAIYAIVNSNVFEKDDITVSSLLDAGYNRCIIESMNIVFWVNELIQIKNNDVRLLAQYASSKTLYTGLDNCRDIVIITDDTYRIQHMNTAGINFLGFKNEDTLGKYLQETIFIDAIQVNVMGSHLKKGRNWMGQVNVKRKQNDPTIMPCKALAVSCVGRQVTHFVIILDCIVELDNFNVMGPKEHMSGRPSIDLRSLESSFLKITTLPYESTTQKVISYIQAAKEQSFGNPGALVALEKAVELMKGSSDANKVRESVLRKSEGEPVAADLIDALLTQQTPALSVSTSRRSSLESQVSKVFKSRMKLPKQLKDLLATSMRWDFDIIHLEELTVRRPLLYLGMHLFLHFDVPSVLNCEEKVFYNWLIVMESNYRDNWYHNSTHASDVMQAIAVFIKRQRLEEILTPLDYAICLIAGAAHDLDHPGKSSAFLANSRNPLAILYNDLAVLESHHSAFMFKLTLEDQRLNIFKNLDFDTFRTARSSIIDMILATEMTKHFEHLSKFVTVFCTPTEQVEDTTNYVPLDLPENMVLIKRIMIKCADVSNPTRPLGLCVEWAQRITEEYFAQTDEEKSMGLPVVMPKFDRQTCSIPKSQIGFVDYIVHDMFEAWNAFIDMPELLANMTQNYNKWREFEEMGYSTLADVRKLQVTLIKYPSIIKTKLLTKFNKERE